MYRLVGPRSPQRGNRHCYRLSGCNQMLSNLEGGKRCEDQAWEDYKADSTVDTHEAGKKFGIEAPCSIIDSIRIILPEFFSMLRLSPF